MLTFHDVPISPYTEYYRGGPIWPQFDSRTWERHCCSGRPVDQEPVPLEGEPEFLTGAYAWAGPVRTHFGHQLAEFGMRLAPTLRVDPEARFLFAPHHDERTRLRSMEDVPGHLQQVLEWFGVPPSRTHLVIAPAVVECLAVAPQAEQLGGGILPDDAHLDWLDAHAERRLGPVGSRAAPVVYVSRSRMISRFAGEAYVEGLLRDAGCVVIHPEELSLREQVAWYRDARTLIFPEGSAIHGLQLLGRTRNRVVVLRRSPSGLMNVPAILSRRAGSFQDLSFLRGHLSPRNADGSLLPQWGIGVLDEDRWMEVLVGALEGVGISGRLRTRWNPVAFQAAVSRDLEAWIREIQGCGFTTAHHLEPILEQLDSLDLPEAGRALEEHLQSSQARHGERLDRFLRSARDVLPSDARSAVISRGDPRALELGGARAWHFPGTPDGDWLGYHPADDAEAIRMLEDARSSGAGYLLIPRWEGWWLDHYAGFRLHLEALTRTPSCRVDGGWLFRLDEGDRAQGVPSA